MTRFEIKPMNQNKCPYCHFPSEGWGKDFMVQLDLEKECMAISEHKEHFYITCVTNDTANEINGIQERFSLDINYCPICGRNLYENERN